MRNKCNMINIRHFIWIWTILLVGQMYREMKLMSCVLLNPVKLFDGVNSNENCIRYKHSM